MNAVCDRTARRVNVRTRIASKVKGRHTLFFVQVFRAGSWNNVSPPMVTHAEAEIWNSSH